MKKFLNLILLSAVFSVSVHADFKLRQQVTIGVGQEGFTQERAVWVKGARERSEGRFVAEDEQTRQMMEQMMPPMAEVKQCDLRQTLKINDRSKKYFIEPFYVSSDDKPLPSVPASTKTEVKKGGTVTWTYTLTDTGERRQMFGLTARRLIIKQLAEASKDSCGGESKMSMTEEGWYVYLLPETANCTVELPRAESSKGGSKGCRDKVAFKGNFRYPGFMLEGKTEMTDLLTNDTMTTSVKTLEVSKATLEMSLFDIPAGYAEVNSEQSLMSGMSSLPTGGIFDSSGAKTSNKKAVAVDFFAGSVSKINQSEMRQHVARKVSTSSFEGVMIASQNDINSGAYSYVVGVEIKSAKESGASKIGGLFGKVTGNTEAAKLGKSEAEIVVTLYDKDGKTVLATGTAKEKVDGKADDAVRAAIDKAILPILARMK